MSDTVIVIPCYNEVERLPVATLSEFIADHRPFRFVFVNDGSSDGTSRLLHHLRDLHRGRCDVIDLARNVGKAEAVRQGMLLGLKRNARYLGYWDADLATPLDELPRFREVLDMRPHIQIVLGSRLPLLGHAVRRRPYRRLLGKIFATLASSVLAVRLRDTQCGAKLFRCSDLLAAALAQRFVADWAFDVELLARWKVLACSSTSAGLPGPKLTDVVYELPLQAWRDVSGSKLRASAMTRAALQLGRIAMSYRGPAGRAVAKRLTNQAVFASPASPDPVRNDRAIDEQTVRTRLQVVPCDACGSESPHVPTLPAVRSLAIGPLTPLQRLCIQSFVAHGHPYELYSYQHYDDLPVGVESLDARSLLQADPRLVLGSRWSAQCARFSESFRYKLLHAHGGYWVDTDVFCLRSFDFADPYVFGEEDQAVSNCVLRAPAGCELMRRLWMCTSETYAEPSAAAEQRGTLVDMVAAQRLLQYVKPRHILSPIAAIDLPRLAHRVTFAPWVAESYSIHLRSSVWIQQKLDYRNLDKPGTLLRLLREHLDATSAGTAQFAIPAVVARVSDDAIAPRSPRLGMSAHRAAG